MTFSILISTYGADYWRELAQTRAVPSAEAQNPHEVFILHEPDGTIASCRNNNAARATGDWLVFLDADDELNPGYIDAMKAREQQAVYQHDYIVRESQPRLLQPAVSYVRNGRHMPARILGPGDLRHDNYLVIGTAVPRHLFEQVGGFNDYPHGFEDWSCWAKCWKAGAVVVPVPRAVYRAHINPRSKHRLMWRDRKLQVETHLRVQAELFPEMTA